MTDSARQLVTIEDWVAQDDDARMELVEGHFVRKALPSLDHSFAQARVLSSLTRLGGQGGPGPDEGWWIGTEVHVIYSGRPNGFIHDIAGWRKSTRDCGSR